MAKKKYNPKMSDYSYLHKSHSILNKFGPKQMSMVKSFIPSVAVFSGAAAIFTLYLTDWRVICDCIPFYNTKFVNEKPET